MGRSLLGGSSSYHFEIPSDHFSILLRVGEVSRGRRPFKFESMWLEADDFSDLVKSVWDELDGTKLKQWNREVFPSRV